MTTDSIDGGAGNRDSADLVRSGGTVATIEVDLSSAWEPPSLKTGLRRELGGGVVGQLGGAAALVGAAVTTDATVRFVATGSLPDGAGVAALLALPAGPTREPSHRFGAGMTDPLHLNDHHRDTVAKILQHPTGHNVEWHAVLSLLENVGEVEQRHDGRFKITVGTETEIFDKPKHKDIDEQQVIDLRRMLSAAGYTVDPKRQS